MIWSKQHKRFSTYALALAWAVALTGCVAADKAAGECASDSDCVAGLKCFEARFCVAATVADTPVVIRVSPPSDSGFVVEQFSVTLTGDSQNEPRRLVLTEPAVIRGTVTQKNNGLASSFPGTLLASAPSDVAGRNLTFQCTSYSALKRFPGSDTPQGYELRVQKGNNYALAFWPQSAEIPPHYSTLTAGDSIEQWNLVLPADSELKTLTGKIVMGDKPVVGLSVWLRDEQGQAWSTRGKTDATGTYAFKVDPSAPPARLVFAPDTSAPGAQTNLLPAGEVAMPLAVTTIVGDLPAIHLAEVPTLTTTTLHVRGPDGQPIAGTSVHLTMKLADLPDDVTLARLSLDWTGLTDAAGVVQLTVPPLVGDLVITPPPKSMAAREALYATSLKAGDVQVNLKSRIHVTGTVKDFASRSVPGAEVTLREVEGSGESADSDGDEATFITTPDADGNFALWVDPGKYAVWVDPPSRTSLARVMARIDDVNADTASTPWHLVLPPPMVLAGVVLTQAGAEVLGVQIDVLAVKVQTPRGTNGRGGGGDGELGKRPSGTVVLDSHFLGSALSDITGHFEVLLAPGQVAAQ